MFMKRRKKSWKNAVWNKNFNCLKGDKSKKRRKFIATGYLQCCKIIKKYNSGKSHSLSHRVKMYYRVFSFRRCHNGICPDLLIWNLQLSLIRRVENTNILLWVNDGGFLSSKYFIKAPTNKKPLVMFNQRSAFSGVNDWAHNIAKCLNWLLIIFSVFLTIASKMMCLLY